MVRIFSILCSVLFIWANGIAQNDGFKFLALGDSYTAGTGEIQKNSWPVQFVASLKKKGIEVTESQIIAKAGWTTTDLLNQLESENPGTDFNLVSLLIGVNNQYRNIDISIFEKEFPLLLEKSITLAKNDSKNVFVLSIPDWSVTPFAKFKDKSKIVKALKAYNSIIEKEAKRLNVQFIEITKISRNAGVNPGLIASDSLHPSKKMYRMWVKRIQKKILK